mmetsp:Transcript_39679/g.94198  ORF Transcript_39679/g.94198 Transcript_39679/m.94198 type:complete len:355 (-) Transcript_39679:50-1114(-)
MHAAANHPLLKTSPFSPPHPSACVPPFPCPPLFQNHPAWLLTWHGLSPPLFFLGGGLPAQVYVEALADRFLRLMMQLLGRYRHWLSAALAYRRQYISAGEGEKPEPGKGDSLNPEWILKLAPEDLVLLRLDVALVAASIAGPYSEELSARLAHLGSEAAELVVGAIKSRSESIREIGGNIDEAIATVVVDKCIQVLKQLRGIRALYLRTSRPMPTRPSHYVSGALSPLSHFLETAAVGKLSSDTRFGLVRRCVAAASQSFADMAKELLEEVRKTEDSLKRLKKGRAQKPPPGSSDADQPSDQKIGFQLFLDAQEFGRQLQAFGLQPEELPEFRALWATVAPADKQDSIVIADSA